MAENLKVTHYRNGDPIPEFSIEHDTASPYIGASTNYKNNPQLDASYGRLYNWREALNSASILQKLYILCGDNQVMRRINTTFDSM
jgi:hypothetical protein